MSGAALLRNTKCSENIQNALLIYNLASGRRRHRRFAEIEEAARILNAAGIRTELAPTTGRGTATGIARHAVAQNRDLVITCGGDGTINEVINGLAGSQVPMALLPAGTANILAKELGIPWDIPAAARLIPASNLRRIALGSVMNATAQGHVDPSQGCRYFLCVAGAGPDGAMVHAIDPALKDRTGIIAYWAEGIRQLIKYRFPEMSINWMNSHLNATLIVVGRTAHYGGPFKITTGASLFASDFEIVAYTTRSRLKYHSRVTRPLARPTPQNPRHLRLENQRGNLPPHKRRNRLRPGRRRTSRHAPDTLPRSPRRSNGSCPSQPQRVKFRRSK